LLGQQAPPSHLLHYFITSSLLIALAVIPNLPAELEIILLRLSDQVVVESDPGYRPQFRADFWVRRDHVLAWLCYLKGIHPDYRYITISLDRTRTLPVDGDISSFVTFIIDNRDVGAEPREPSLPVLGQPVPKSQSVSPNFETPAEMHSYHHCNNLSVKPKLSIQKPDIAARVAASALLRLWDTTYTSFE